MDKAVKKKDNRGMSLVEIILVIALMTVVAVASGYGLSLINKKPVQECAKKVEIALNQNRTNSMGKKVARLEFSMDGNRVAVREFTQSAGESLVDGPVTVIGATDIKLRFIYKDAAGNEVDRKILGGDVLTVEVSFKRDSGSLLEEADGAILDRIEVYKASSYETAAYDAAAAAGNVMTVSIEKLTGKVTVQ